MWFFSSRKTRRITTKPSSRPTFRPRVRALEDRCLMSAGMLDPTFNPAGCPQAYPTPTPAGTAMAATKSTSMAYGVVVQPSGKIVLAGDAFGSGGVWDVSLAEFDPNGSLDSNFGSKGIVTNTSWVLPYGRGAAAVLYPTGSSGDQKILVVGASTSGTFTLARYNADGSLDKSFGKNGTVNTSFTQGGGTSGGLLDGVALVPNGTSLPKIVMAGSDTNNAGVEMARYNPDGSLDTSFGSGGKLYTPVPGGITVSTLALDPLNGDLIVAGSTLAAFKANGSLDSSFGSNGVLPGNAGAAACAQGSLAIYPATDSHGNAGKILWYNTRYNLDGTLDPSWTTVTSVSALTLAIQLDDKVVAADFHWNVARLNADGSLDTSFGNGGIANAGFGTMGLPFNALAVAVEPNGDIVEAASARALINNTITYVFAVARFLPSEPEIGSLTASQVMAGGPVALTASNISDANPNSTISQVSFFYYDSNGNKVIVGTVTAPDGSGNWTWTGSLAAGSYTLYAQATDSYGVLGDPLAYSLTVQ